MNSEARTRYSGIFAIDLVPITLVGLGGIGSFTALALAKSGAENVKMYDFDIVSEENVGTQLYAPSTVGNYKADVLQDMILEFTGTGLPAFVKQVQPTDWISGFIVISAVDGINNRKQMWEAVTRTDHTVWYIDTRMGAQSFQMLTVDMRDRHWYEKYLWSVSEDDVPDLPCTSKATVYTALHAAARVAAAVVALSMAKPWPRFIDESLDYPSSRNIGGVVHNASYNGSVEGPIAAEAAR